MKEKIKKWGWFVLMILACPCHLVIIIALLAGTTLSSFLIVHKTPISSILVIVFAISLYMGGKQMLQKEKAEQKDCCILRNKDGNNVNQVTVSQNNAPSKTS